MRTKKVLSLLLAMAFMTPVIASAQSEDLRAAILASILSDTRAQTIPPEQLKILVDSLVAQAQAQNISASDILWKPQVAETAAVAVTQGTILPTKTSCAPGWNGYLCQFNLAFGFEGGSYEIPLFLLITSGLLIAVLWEVIAHHRKLHAVQTPPESTSGQGAPPTYV